MSDWQPRRAERKALVLAERVAEHVRARPDECVSIARRNLARMRTVASSAGAHRWLDEWEALLDAGPDAMIGMLTERSVHADDLRQMNPFAGVLDEAERREVLDRFARRDRREGVS